MRSKRSRKSSINSKKTSKMESWMERLPSWKMMIMTIRHRQPIRTITKKRKKTRWVSMCSNPQWPAYRSINTTMMNSKWLWQLVNRLPWNTSWTRCLRQKSRAPSSSSSCAFWVDHCFFSFASRPFLSDACRFVWPSPFHSSPSRSGIRRSLSPSATPL